MEVIWRDYFPFYGLVLLFFIGVFRCRNFKFEFDRDMPRATFDSYGFVFNLAD